MILDSISWKKWTLKKNVRTSFLQIFKFSPATTDVIAVIYCLLLPLRLEQQVQDKEALERKLYSRFVPVMNEKKAKIRGLQDELQHLQRTKEKQSDEEGRQRSAWNDFWILFPFFCIFFTMTWLHIYECRGSRVASVNCADTLKLAAAKSKGTNSGGESVGL